MTEPAAYPPPPAYQPASATDGPVPGKTLGIVAFILSFFIQLVALILGIIALVQSRKAGAKNGWALAAIIISVVLMVIGIIVLIVSISAAVSFGTAALDACRAADFTGTVTVNGVPVQCSTLDH
jgi:hypothetical protein